MTNAIHTAAFVSDPTGLNASSIDFRCHGDAAAPCHNYPGCDCESWSTDHKHPYVQHARCWMQDWFDNGAVSYNGLDAVDDNDFGGAPPASKSGAVTCSFSGDYIEWEWA